ncbi:MAG: DUF4145 domain-containing protein [Nanoarchaeota archaeon]
MLKTLLNLQNAVNLAIKNNIDLNKKLDHEKAIYNYDEKQKVYYLNNLLNQLKFVRAESLELMKLVKFDIRNEVNVSKILELMPDLENKDLAAVLKSVQKLIELVKQLNIPKIEPEKTFSISAVLPQEILPDVQADIKELNKCFNNDCFRSAVILCGRLLETALHRKYYEVTGNDLLEKSPGIGLGNIIAKLKEKELVIDPALTNQIHLINQVRIFSVHKKKEAFYPSKQQTQATILYTLDILEKIFKP